MTDYSDTDDETIDVQHDGDQTTIESEIGTVTIDLSEADDEFELADGTPFGDLSRQRQVNVLWEHAETGLVRWNLEKAE